MTNPSASTPSGVLPQRWPSAWSSLGKNALLGSVIPVVAAAVVLAILLLTSSLATAWWVILIPLVAALWPLSLPMRVRKVVQDAADAGELQITQATLGHLALVPTRRLGVRPNAEVVPGRAVRYYLNANSSAKATKDAARD